MRYHCNQGWVHRTGRGNQPWGEWEDIIRWKRSKTIFEIYWRLPSDEGGGVTSPSAELMAYGYS